MLLILCDADEFFFSVSIMTFGRLEGEGDLQKQRIQSTVNVSAAVRVSFAASRLLDPPVDAV